jgi:hypothetical protein
MDSAKSVTCTFDNYTGTQCINPPFKIGGVILNYPTIQSAYDVLGDGEMLEIRALSFTECLLNLNQYKSVGLSGGYDCDFLSITGFATVHGTLTINGGTVSIKNLIIQ